MSIATEFTRIQSDRNTIRNKLVELGMANSTDKLDALAGAIENLINQGAVKVEVREGETYTIPAGYHNGSGTVSGVKGGGNYTLQEKTVTPTKQQLHIASDDGYYGLSAVTVNAIPDAYQDVTSVTATADKVLVGKIFVDKEGNVIAGTMTDHTNDSSIVPLTVERNTYTIPEGYHDGKRSVGIAYGTASVTPSKERQTVQGSGTADNGSGNMVNHEFLGKVIVEPIPDKYQDVSGVDAGVYDVLEGKKYVNKNGDLTTGGMPNRGAIQKVMTTETIGGSYTIPEGYHNGQGTVSIDFEEKTATPTKSSQTIKPTSGKVLKQVVVNPIPDNFADVSEVDAPSTAVLEGYWFVNANGQRLPGAMKNNENISETIDGFNATSVTIPRGYTYGGTVSLTNDIENALKEI